MYCRKCGKEIPDNAKFCSVCGNPAPQIRRPAPQTQQQTQQQPQPQMRVPAPQQQQPQMQQTPPKKKSAALIVILAIVAAIALIGGVVAFLFMKGYVGFGRLQGARTAEFADDDDDDDNDEEDTDGDNSENGDEGNTGGGNGENADIDSSDNGEMTGDGADVSAGQTALDSETSVAEEASTDWHDSPYVKKFSSQEFPLYTDRVSYPSSDSWQNTYLQYIRDEGLERNGPFTCYFIYVNDDEIPEIVLDTGVEAGGCLILTCNGSVVSSLQTNRLGFSYIERGNLLNNDGGHMDYYYDYVVTIDEDTGGWKGVCAGEYYTDTSTGKVSEWDDELGRYRCTDYIFNGEKVTEEEYLERLHSIYDESIAGNDMYNYHGESLPDFIVDQLGGQAAGGEYILPDSSIRLLTESDLAGLDAVACRKARNEIYARHGRKFKDTGVQAYFNSLSWYNGTIAPDDFDESILSDIEIANLKLIRDYEKSMGYN